MEDNYDIICIAETWLTKHFKTEEYIPSSYNVHRRDRHLQEDTYEVGGGVLVAVSNKFSSVPVYIDNCDLEMIAVRIKFHIYSLIICAVYIPYNSNPGVYSSIFNTISSQITPNLQPKDRLMILGDFNLPNVEWEYVDDILTPINLKADTECFISDILSLGLKQCVTIKNNFGNVLDLAFLPMDHEVRVSVCDDLAGSSSIFHSPLNILVLFEFCEPVSDKVESFRYNFIKGDYCSFNSLLEGYDWASWSSINNIDAMLKEFYSIIYQGIDKFIPKILFSRIKKEPWYNNQLINLKNRKDKAHKRFKMSPNASNYAAFDVLRKKYTYLNRFLYNNYILEIESNIRSRPDRFWKFVNSNRNSSGYPTTMFLQERVCDNLLDACNLFADFFESVYTVKTCLPNPTNDLSCPQFLGFRLEIDDVLSELLELNVNQSAGPDSVPPLVLKMNASVIAQPITDLFNKSLADGYFPSLWKSSAIKPIFKYGVRCDIENYRGICILSVLPKLFEKLVNKHLSFHCKQIISSKQHGFVSGRSTVTNLVLLTNFVSSALSNGNNVEVVYTDFSKAFDKIDHFLLIKKLVSLNYNFLPIKWITSYLDSRTQFVKIGDVVSRTIHVSSGVPQGSHLGPLLFILFINNVVDCLRYSEILMYADDIKIFKTIKNNRDIIDFQSDLTSFSSWCSEQKLQLNVSKCSTICFTRSRLITFSNYFLLDSVINRVFTFKDLGITFTSDLSFSKHIDGCISKANSMLGFIKRFSRDFHDPYVIKTLYLAFVRSQLEYGAIIWDPIYANYSNRIESCQKRFLMYALRRLPRDADMPAFILPSYRGRCKLLDIEPLFIRRLESAAIFVRDLLVSKIDCADILQLFNVYAPARVLRDRDFQLKLPYRNTNYAKSEPVYHTSVAFNEVRVIFDFNLSRDVFKKRLSFFLLDHW